MYINKSTRRIIIAFTEIDLQVVLSESNKKKKRYNCNLTYVIYTFESEGRIYLLYMGFHAQATFPCLRRQNNSTVATLKNKSCTKTYYLACQRHQLELRPVLKFDDIYVFFKFNK